LCKKERSGKVLFPRRTFLDGKTEGFLNEEEVSYRQQRRMLPISQIGREGLVAHCLEDNTGGGACQIGTSAPRESHHK